MRNLASLLYKSNWIERLNKSFRRTLKIRNALPSVSAVITLMGFVSMYMEEKTYKYALSVFKYDSKFYRNDGYIDDRNGMRQEKIKSENNVSNKK